MLQDICSDVPFPCCRLSACYESLVGGNTGNAVVDFTGAVSESIDLVQGKFATDLSEQMNLFEDLLKVYERGGIISCSIKVYFH